MSTKENVTGHMNQLIEKAADATKSEDAMRFSQAALNVAHALATLNNMNVKTPDNIPDPV